MSRKTAIICHDIGMAVLAWLLAWLARFNFDFPYPYLHLSLVTLPVVVIMQSIIFQQFNLYRGVWRFASLPDLWNILRAVLLGALCITLVLFILFRLEDIPRTILVLYPSFLILLLSGPRLGYRLWKDKSLQHITVRKAVPVLIIGAGRAGASLVHDMLSEGEYIPVGFLDDDPQLHDSEIHGVRVTGPVDEIRATVDTLNPSIIVIAIPSASDEQMQRIASQCELTGLPVRTLPKLSELISGKSLLDKLHDLSIEDMLGREKVELDWEGIQVGILNKTVLVTGGGGSIGAELCRQIASLGPAKLIILEQSEFNLYKISKQLNELYPLVQVRYELGDICDQDGIDFLFRTCTPDVVFHSAAYKHVPILQNHCREAVRNNIFGTLNLVTAADRYRCEKFVFISTDKAVNPTSVLGKTKRIAEMVCEKKGKDSRTLFITVRFGNVLGSDGSVLQLFQEQIGHGGPLTVTHPDVKRYFMTIREACQLILQASVLGNESEIFVLDMGKAVRITFLAEQLIKLSGHKPDGDIRIEYTGLRPGEKLVEELFHADEERKITAHEKILLARYPDIDAAFIDNKLVDLDQAVTKFNEDILIRIMDETISGANVTREKKGKVISIT